MENKNALNSTYLRKVSIGNFDLVVTFNIDVSTCPEI